MDGIGFRLAFPSSYLVLLLFSFSPFGCWLLDYDSTANEYSYEWADWNVVQVNCLPYVGRTCTTGLFHGNLRPLSWINLDGSQMWVFVYLSGSVCPSNGCGCVLYFDPWFNTITRIHQAIHWSHVEIGIATWKEHGRRNDWLGVREKSSTIASKNEWVGGWVNGGRWPIYNALCGALSCLITKIFIATFSLHRSFESPIQFQMNEL